MPGFNDFRIGWRQLRQDPAYSAVVIVGLAIGIAVAFLLMGFVRSGLMADAEVPERARIARVELRYQNPGGAPVWWGETPVPLKEEIERQAGGIAALSRFYRRQLSVQAGTQVLPAELAFVDAALPAMLGLAPQAGDLARSLARPDALALTADMAQRLFGGQDVVGRTVSIARRPYLVAAVLPDRPRNSAFRFDALASTASGAWDTRELAFREWGHHGGQLYLQVVPGADLAEMGRRVQAIFDATAWSAEFEPSSRINGHAAEIRLMPLERLSFEGARAPVSVALYGGLAALAAVILTLAGINYVNLGTVRALQRQREIGIRKSLGASPGRVMRQFLAESLLAALLATALGLALARLAWPLLVEQLGKRYDTPFVPSMLLAAVLVGVAGGLLAGLYPAWIAARVPAGQVLAGRDRQEGAAGLWLRRGLTVLQFAAAIALSALAVAIMLQTRHAIRVDPGFDAAPLLVVDAPPRLADAEIEQLREALARLPGVRAAARSGDTPGRRQVRASSTVALPGSTRMLSFRHESVDPHFFAAYGIRPLAGRLFAPGRDTLDSGEEVVLNRSAAAQFGFASPQAAIGRAFRRDDLPLRVAGVIEDIRHVSLREPPEPTYYRIERDQMPTLTLRAEGDRAALKAQVEALWLSRYPGEAPRVEWLSTQLEEGYGDDVRLSQALLAAAAVATLIAGCGLYALAAYSVRRRAREIAIRKLYGAGRGAIAALLAREFGMLVLLGAVVGLPLGWLAIARYLDGFVERAPLGIWPLAAAVLAAGAVAVLAVGRHVRVALALRPAQVIEG